MLCNPPLHSIFSLIEQSYRRIQISCKGHPDKIGNQKISCPFVQPIKQYHIQQNEQPKQNQPHKSHPIGLQIKKQNRPEKVKDQLDPVYSQGGSCPIGLPCRQHQIGRNPHENEQRRPHHGKQPRRRGQGWLIQRAEGLHGRIGDKGRKAAHNQRDCQANQQFFPLNIHKKHLHTHSMEVVLSFMQNTTNSVPKRYIPIPKVWSYTTVIFDFE